MVKWVFVLGLFVCYLGSSPLLPPASFRSGDRTVVISYLLGAFGVCPPAITADSVRLYSFRLPNRGDIVILVSCVLY